MVRAEQEGVIGTDAAPKETQIREVMEHFDKELAAMSETIGSITHRVESIVRPAEPDDVVEKVAEEMVPFAGELNVFVCRLSTMRRNLVDLTQRIEL